MLLSISFSYSMPSPGLVPKSIPELVPGPGLPSLASLNLTTEDLYSKALDSLGIYSLVIY